MATHFAAEPKNGSLLVRNGLNKLSLRQSPLSALNVDFSLLQVNPPHAVYDLHADRVASGSGVTSVTATGFRYLIQSGANAVAAAEVLADGHGNASTLANINYGAYVTAWAQALKDVASLPKIASGSFEVRLLRFAAVGLMALWLKSDAGAADYVYPLAPAPAGVQASTLYSPDDLMKLLLPLAQKRATNKTGPATP